MITEEEMLNALAAKEEAEVEIESADLVMDVSMELERDLFSLTVTASPGVIIEMVRLYGTARSLRTLSS